MTPRLYWNIKWRMAEEVTYDNVHRWMSNVEEQSEDNVMWAKSTNGDTWQIESVYHAKDQTYLVADNESLHVCKTKSCRAAKNEAGVVHSMTWKVLMSTSNQKWYSRTESIKDITVSLKTFALFKSLTKKLGIGCRKKRQALTPISEDQR